MHTITFISRILLTSKFFMQTVSWIMCLVLIISKSVYSLHSKSVMIGILQVFGDKAFEKFGKGLISIHFSDNHTGIHKKVLMFKFVLPAAKNMADMSRLIALVPYYIDLIGRYKLSSQVGEFGLSFYLCLPYD